MLLVFPRDKLRKVKQMISKSVLGLYCRATGSSSSERASSSAILPNIFITIRVVNVITNYDPS